MITKEEILHKVASDIPEACPPLSENNKPKIELITIPNRGSVIVLTKCLSAYKRNAVCNECHVRIGGYLIENSLP